MTKPNEILLELVKFSEALAKGDYSRRIIAPVDDSQLSRICQNLNLLADQLQINPVISRSFELEVKNFIDVISSYANRDFNKKLIISENSNMLDAIAIGVNILGEELQYTTVSKEELQKERDQLKIAKEAAENANKAKAVFLGNLSHEIRTPLQGIIGFAEILQGDSAANKRKEYAEIIERRANDLLKVIEDLLDLSVIESGEVQAHPEVFNLKEAIQNIFNDFCEDAKAQHIELAIQNQVPDAENVYIDRLHLRQVILNLLNNSLKFTDQGNITLVSLKQNDHFIVKVVDSGIGIESTKTALIFEPFRQAREGLSRPKEGIGLGLPICKRRVEMWGGVISVYSKPGHGSQFIFTIPLYF